MELDDLLDDIEKDAEAETDEPPEAEKLADCLEKIAEAEEDAAKYRPLDKVAEAIQTVKLLSDEDLI